MAEMKEKGAKEADLVWRGEVTGGRTCSLQFHGFLDGGKVKVTDINGMTRIATEGQASEMYFLRRLKGGKRGKKRNSSKST